MIGWEELYFFEAVLMRMSGFVLFNPILGRNNIPGYVKAGIILVLSAFLYSLGMPDQLAVPETVLALVLHLLLELAGGFVLGFIMQLCIAVVQVGGEMIDAQMGLTMAQVYDSSSQVNMTVTAAR